MSHLQVSDPEYLSPVEWPACKTGEWIIEADIQNDICSQEKLRAKYRDETIKG